MLCHNCGADNPQGRRFCEECGERLATIEHRREKDRTRARRAAAKSRLEDEGLTPAEKRRKALRARKPTLKLKRGRALAALAVVVSLIILVVVLVLVFTGSASTPAKAVQGFLDSLQKKDLAAYLQHTDPVTYAEVKKQGLTLNPNDYFIYTNYRISGIKLETVSSTADTAVVKITGGVMEADLTSSTFGTQTLDFSKHPRTVQLAKVEGSWVITNYQDVQLPYEVPQQVSPDQSGVDEGL